MPTTLSEPIYTSAPSQPTNENGDIKMREPPALTVSTAALRVGLAHFIHEINNPLQQVYWTAKMMDTLMPKANGSGDPFVGKLFQELTRGLDRLISLVSSLELQLKALWMINPSSESVNVNSLIDEILQTDLASLGANGIRIDKETGTGLPLMQADKQLLRYVFLNLFRNAADAMPKGGVLSVRAGTRRGSLWIEVSDTGIEMPPDLDVFQPFATSKPEGMGLGLAITRHIVEIHGGTISYRSDPGKGKTFYLSFPQMFETEEDSTRLEAAQYGNPNDHWDSDAHAESK